MPELRPLPPGTLLYSGAHSPNESRLCVVEAATYMAGEPHSDHPQCVSEVIAASARRLNDNVAWPDDATRTEVLRDLPALMVGTRDDTPAGRDRHLRLLLLPIIREMIAPLFDKPVLESHAAALLALPDDAPWYSVHCVCRAAGGAAWAASADDAYAAADAASAAAYASAASAAAYASAAAASYAAYAACAADASYAAADSAAAAAYAYADAAAYAADDPLQALRTWADIIRRACTAIKAGVTP